MSKNRPKRPSKAAVARQLEQVQAQLAPRELPADLAAVIAGYQPKKPRVRPMDAIRPFLTEAFSASNVIGVKSVRAHCTHLTELATYAISRGVPLTVKDVLTTELIDEHVRVGMPDNSDRNRQLRRTLLMNVAKAANPGPTAPVALTPIQRTAIRPCYTPFELATLKRVCQIQPTDARSRDLVAMVCLGAGAGLDSVDLRHLWFKNIHYRGAGRGYLINIAGPRPRTVPLRASYEALMAEVVRGRHPDDLVLGKEEHRRDVTAHIAQRAALYKAPHIEQARLRATWLADVMTDPIPVALILHAAGLKSARSMTDLLPHLGPWLEHKNLHKTGAINGDSEATR